MRCIICGLSKDASKEHIIPEAMGNKKFVTYKVCTDCNNKLGANVDNYLTDYIVIKIIRKELGLLGKEETEIKVFPSNALDVNGEKFVFRKDIPTKPPKVELENGLLHVEAESIEQGLELAKKKLERNGYSNADIVEILKKYEKKGSMQYQPTFHLPADIDKGRYLLSGVKIAYEFACETLDDTYFDDGVSKILRMELFKAVKADRENISAVVNYFTLKKYVSLLQHGFKEMKNQIKPLLLNLNPPARHICILHDSADHKLLCEVMLLLEDIISFTVVVSEDARIYDMGGKCVISIVLEDGSVISC